VLHWLQAADLLRIVKTDRGQAPRVEIVG